MPTTKDRPPTTDALRHAITRGKTGDKVDFPDPAAAPLGVDDEAAGTPAGPQARRMAADAEITDAPTRRNQSFWPLWSMILVAVLLIAAAWLALSGG